MATAQIYINGTRNASKGYNVEKKNAMKNARDTCPDGKE